MSQRVSLYYPEAPSGVWAITLNADPTKPAMAFADHACTIAYANRTLSATGRDGFYVDNLVDVSIATANFVPVDSFTVGVSGDAVSLNTGSITGTDPRTGGQIAGGTIQLPDAFDRMFESFGARDFLVKEAGTTAVLTLKDALASLRSTNGRIFNVKNPPFNAVGDGVTFDDAAILSAINAAGVVSGEVYFPSGTYLVSANLVINGLIRFSGDGDFSQIKSTNATAALTVPGTATFEARNMLIWATTANAKLISGAASSDIFLDKIVFLGSGSTNPIDTLGSLTGVRCTIGNISNIAIGAGAAGAVSSRTTTAGDVFRLVDCNFNAGPAAGGTAAVYSTCPTTIIEGATFFNNETSKIVLASAGGTGVQQTITGCTDANPGAGRQFINIQTTTLPVTESGNCVLGPSGPAEVAVVPAAYSALFSSTTKYAFTAQVATTGAVFTPTTYLANHLYDANANATINAPANSGGGAANLWDGLEILIYLRNTTGGAITVTLNAIYHGDTTNLASGNTRYYRFRYKAGGAVTGFIQQGPIRDFT